MIGGGGLAEIFLIMFLGIITAIFLVSLFASFQQRRRKKTKKYQFNSEKKKRAESTEKKSEKHNIRTDQRVKQNTDKAQKREKLVSKRPKPPVYRHTIPEMPNVVLSTFRHFSDKRLLIVEDNIINQKIATNILQESQMHIDIANNGEEALDILFKDGHRYDIILMDISMPVRDGISATRCIREDDRFRMMPIITFTAFGQGEESDQMFDNGANAYFSKPLNINQLYTIFALFIGEKIKKGDALKIYRMLGFDPAEGEKSSDRDKDAYVTALKEFIDKYGNDIEQFIEWIEEEQYGRFQAEAKKMVERCEFIGAIDMQMILQTMLRQFLYNNQSELFKHTEAFQTISERTFETIQLYLDEIDSKKQN